MKRELQRSASIVMLAVILAIAQGARATPGDLDPSFRGSGKFTFGFGGTSDLARAVKVQADGKLVVVGQTRAGSKRVFVVARYHPDGARDNSFGLDGYVLTDIPEAFAADNDLQDDAHAVAIQTDGKIVVAGGTDQQTGNSDFGIVRYHSDGSLDTSFGGTGIVTVDFGGYDFAYDVRLQADGRIVVGGYKDSEFAVTRLNPDGTPDTTFNGTGKVATIVGPGPNRSPRTGMVLMSDNRILMAGSVGGFNGFIVVRYNANGSLDTSFDLDGKVITPVFQSGFATAIALQPPTNQFESDKIVVSGYAFDGSKEVFAAVRYNIVGELDTSFDGDGKVTTAIPGGTQTRSFSMAVEGTTSKQPRKIVLAGFASSTNSSGKVTSYFATVRYNVDGSLDSTFAQDGMTTTGFVGNNSAGAGLVLSAGKIIVVGDTLSATTAGTDFRMLHLNSDGSIDGTRTDDFGGDPASAQGIAMQADGKIILAGAAGETFPNMALARLNPDGTFDNSFGVEGKVLDLRSPIQGNAVTLQADGKIVVAGTNLVGTTFADFSLSRFNSDGSPDFLFGSDGVATIQVTSNQDIAVAVAMQADGKILMAGSSQVGTVDRDVALVRLNPNGSPDNTFDFDGHILIALSTGNDAANAVAYQPDGKVVIAGSAGDSPSRFFVARFNSNGTPDNSFGENGVTFTSIGPGNAVAKALVLLPSGHIVVAGYASNGTDFDFALARYHPNGALDSSLGGVGTVMTPLGTGDDRAHALAIQADGKMVVAGYVNLSGPPIIRSEFALVRYNFDGSLDASYGTGGQARVAYDPNGDDRAFGLALDSSNNAIVAGRARNFFGVAKIEGGPLVPTRLANISTRLRVGTGDNVLIGGFIVTGTQPKRVILRGIGPSLPLANKLANPTLELHGPNGLIEANDNWGDSLNKQAILDSTIPPGNDLESAIVATLPANNAGYTAIVRGANNGTGIGVVEAYDLDVSADSELANISTRGFVQTGDNVLIAGTIVVGQLPQRIIVRAIGPSLSVAGKMQDPTLELRDSNGGLIQENNNWVDSPDKQAIIDTTIPPANDFESAIIATLPANNASYTAVVRGVNNTTGIAVVEVYALN